jgi:DNA mismatch repair protein MutL
MFLFVNDRYFKDRYFNHAIQAAFDGMIPSNKYPSYFLYFQVPTESIDVNVHPTKTEIKFENRKEIYSMLRSAIKQALGQFNISPTIDFDQENSFNVPSLKKGEIVDAPTIKVNPDYNPFNTSKDIQITQSVRRESNSSFTHGTRSEIKPDVDSWENFYKASKTETNNEAVQLGLDTNESEIIIPSKMDNEFESSTKAPYQMHEKFIISPIKSGFIMIDQYRAHSRILYDHLLENWSNTSIKSQQLLFPEEFEISATDMVYIVEVEDKLKKVGFDFSIKNKKSLFVTGLPADFENQSAKQLIEEILSKYKESQLEGDIDFKEIYAKAFASAKAIKKGVKLTIEEMQHLIDQLFACGNPQTSPNGKKVLITYHLDDIIKQFN